MIKMNKMLATILLLWIFLATKNSFGKEPTFICNSIGDFSCMDKNIGGSCSNNGTCYVKQWLIDEPICVCIEEKKSKCGLNSDLNCSTKFPGPNSNGICIISKVLFDEPECKFVALK